MTDQDEEFSSQLIQEEEDFFFDDDSDQEEPDLEESSTSESGTNEDTDESFRRLLAGPSGNKAGLGGIDKDKVNKIIYEASKGSKFFEREKKRDQAVTKRIEKILAKYETVRHQDLTFERQMVDNMIQDMEETRDTSQCICHIDMDAFYASVEELENPELKDVPMAVGSMSMLCTCNYKARQYGVRSAMPGFIGKKLCPELTLIPLHFDKYRAASAKVRAVFEKYDPNFLPMSLDEAYLNLTNYLETTDMTPSELVAQIRKEIFEATQLTASAGIACNKTLAKICSDFNKPNGQHYIPMDRNTVMNFVKTLKVRQIPGVGRVTERVLESLGIKTCGDIYPHRAVLYKLLSPVSFQFMLRNYLGIGSTFFSADVDRKSMSVERTFSAMSDPNQLFEKVRELSELLEKDLEKAGYMGRNVGIKLKSVTYELRVRSKTFPSYIWKAKDIERIAKGLLIKELPVNIRLMGIRVSTMKPRGTEDESVAKYFTKLDNASTEQVTNDTLVCPICNHQLKVDNAKFNQHVDECLNKVEVKEILKNERPETPSPPLQKRLKRGSTKSLLDYYSTNNNQ